jgi:hypothetical protein
MLVKNLNRGKSRNTVKKLRQLEGTGRAFIIQDLGPSKNGFPGGREGWTEVKPQYHMGQILDDLLHAHASAGDDLLYRTASKSNVMRLWYRRRNP